jgi:CheY-like chemotaxis protein
MEGKMPRVFLTCGDAALFEIHRKSFLAEGTFEICVEHTAGIDGMMEAVDLFPDLVVLGTEMPQKDDFEVAEALKLSMPEVPVFLVTELLGMETEKIALAHGIDAAFERNEDLNSLVMNARAACGLE